MSEQLRLMIIDDHDLVNKGLKRVFEVLPWCSACDVAQDMKDGLPLLQKRKPDVLLLDIYLRNTTSFSYIPQIRKASPLTKIIMLTVSDEHEDFVTAARYSVDGYLAKNTPIEELEEKILSAYRGEMSVSSSLAPALFDTIVSLQQEPALTRQEKEVLALVTRGMTNKEIATELQISLYTVKNHVSSILHKTGKTRRYQLIGQE